MSEESKRIDIEDLPRAAEELTDEEAKSVEGGLSKVGAGQLIFSNANSPAGNTVGGSLGAASGNTIGGTLAGDVSNPAKP